MKYQQRSDVIDPDVAPGGTIFGYELDDDPDASNDAYVIGDDGEAIRAPDADAYLGSESGPKPWAKPAAVLLCVVFAALTVWNLSRIAQGPPPPPKLSPFQVKQALYLGVMKIDAYRRIRGVTPDSLSDAGLPDPGPYAYQRLDPGHYRISFASNGAKLEYDSSDPKESFFGSPRELLTMGDSK